jgi:hypothetical protein
MSAYYDKVKKAGEKNGITLIWTEEEFTKNFTILGTKIPIICKCGYKYEKTYYNIIHQPKCRKCGTASFRNTYEKVVNEFYKYDIVLRWDKKEFIQKYENVKQDLPVICVCGENDNISFASVRTGKRCRKCKIKELDCQNLDETYLQSEEKYIANYFKNEKNIEEDCKDEMKKLFPSRYK